MLPESLLCLLSAALAYSQTIQNLTVNNVTSFNTLSLPSNPSFSLPQSEQLSITIALCSKSSSIPQFFVSNSSDSATLDDPEEDPFSEIQFASGLGNWFGMFANGGVLAIKSDSSDDVAFDIGISDSGMHPFLYRRASHFYNGYIGPIHESLTELPFFGDTTSNQALLFSPLFQRIENIKPTYPNFTLPVANMSQPPLPPTFPNYTLVLTPTSSGFADGLQTGCFLSNQNTSGTIANETLWARGDEGFRTQWLIGGLTPSTNYTAFVLEQNNTKVSGPIFFATKSGQYFPVQLFLLF
jgi:calcium channel MID1